MCDSDGRRRRTSSIGKISGRSTRAVHDQPMLTRINRRHSSMMALEMETVRGDDAVQVQ